MSTNKQQLQLNNTDLQSILSTVIGLPTQESCKNGKYVWGKYDGYTPAKSGTISFSVVSGGNTSSTGKQTCNIQMSLSGNLSFEDITPEVLTGHEFCTFYASTNYTLTFYENSQVQLNRGGIYYADYTIDTSTGIISFTILYGGNVNNSGYQKTMYDLKHSKPAVYGEHLGFVVDDDNSAYPDGGTQDGFYYEKVSASSFEVDFGEVTVASSTNKIIISHSLGNTPTNAVLMAENESSNAINATLYPRKYNDTYTKSMQSIYGISTDATAKNMNYNGFTVDETTVEFYCSAYKYPAGKYKWICW